MNKKQKLFFILGKKSFWLYGFAMDLVVHFMKI